MTGRKKYVLIPEKDFQALLKKAALKTKPEKLLTIQEAKTHSKKQIRKLAAKKL
jgi:hypothetical protein